MTDGQSLILGAENMSSSETTIAQEGPLSQLQDATAFLAFTPGSRGVVGIARAGSHAQGIPSGQGVVGILGDFALPENLGFQPNAGVLGYSPGTGIGVFGMTQNGPAGVKGVAISDIGVVGIQGDGVDPRTIDSFGVAGTSNLKPGVFGHSNSAAGVRGESVSDVGVLGTSADLIGVTGIQGASVDPRNVDMCGVGGSADSGTGVLGLSKTQFGVRGVSDADAGVAGESKTGTGVRGESAAFFGVIGVTSSGPAGVEGSASSTLGVHGISASGDGVRGDSDTGVGVHGISTGGVAGQFDGKVVVNGDLNVTGTKSAVAKSRDGSFRKLYAVESPESWFEDFGTAQLENGHAQVRLDANYAALIHDDDYRVFLTPLGDCKGLYVDALSPQGFDVHELQRGTSDIRFDYRVVAKRADVKAPRLECVMPPPSTGAAIC
jgi:hypothetical protein